MITKRGIEIIIFISIGVLLSVITIALLGEDSPVTLFIKCFGLPLIAGSLVLWFILRDYFFPNVK
jgi:hypothetical protein